MFSLSHPLKPKKWAVLLLASAGMVACGGDDYGDDPTPTSTPEPTPAVVFPAQDAAPSVLNLAETGGVFTSATGLSLYFFDNDSQGTSVCEGVDGDPPGTTDDPASCAGRWPPLLAGDSAQQSGAFTVIERSDGTNQWSYNGYALYTFADDANQGDINGDGVGGVWHLARPVPATSATLNGVPTLVGNGEALSATASDGTFTTARTANGEWDGFTLYTFDLDPLDEPACYGLSDGGCINAWPPLLADAGARPYGKLAVIDVDGQTFRQWAYNGKPLYFFAGDSAAGDTNGEGVNDVWWVATEEAAIFRTVAGRDDAVLSAVGRVETLLPEGESTENFVKTTVDKDQFTLYTFDNDGEFDSNCAGACQVNWPPLLAAADDQDVGALQKFTRDDGEMQWAYNGRPLYFYIGDAEPKQTEGDGVGGVWHLVNPPLITAFAFEDGELGETITVAGEVDVLVDGEVMRQDKRNFQLYIFDNDGAEDSNCSDGCAANWPALLATDDDVAAAPFSIFTRAQDGRRQWAVNGYPLYFFTPDTTADDAAGEGVGDVWWVARPAPLRVLPHPTAGNIFIAHGRNVLASQGNAAESLRDLTLYIFDEDVQDDVSTCFDACAATWPPLYASSADQAYGSYTVIERDEDGTPRLQWSYKGDPLYFFAADSAIGDTLGDYPGWPIASP